MSELFRTLTLLRALQDEIPMAWRRNITDHFRVAYLHELEEAKLRYCQAALESQVLSVREIAAALGYSSSGMVDAISKGSISLEKFDLLQATLGAKIAWPPAIERRTLALIDTIEFVKRTLMKQPVTTSLDHESFYCLEQALSEDLTLHELRHEGEEQGWLDRLLLAVRAITPSKHIKRSEDLCQLLVEWAPAYSKTKDALQAFVRTD